MLNPLELEYPMARAAQAATPVLPRLDRTHLLAIDFEASCLPRDGRSFPIEVGVSDIHGNSCAWLIRPMPEWRDWTWSREAEALHGISREQLQEEGVEASRVLESLAAVVGPARVISDSHLDDVWLRQLAESAGAPRPFRVGHIANVLDELGSRAEDMARAETALSAHIFRRHHARDDARRLAMLAGLLMETATVPAVPALAA